MAEVATLQSDKLRTLAERINEEHRACEAAKVSALEHAMEAGRLLAEVKAALAPQRAYEAWVAAKFEGSDRTARAYKQLYERREDLIAQNGNGVATMSLRDTLKALAVPREPYGPPIPGVEPPTPEQEKRQRAKERAEQRLLRKAEFALRTGSLDPPADLSNEEAKNWRTALLEAMAVREQNLPNVLDILGHQLGILSKSKLAAPDKAARCLTERVGYEEADKRAIVLAELHDGIAWLQRVLEEAEREQRQNELE